VAWLPRSPKARSRLIAVAAAGVVLSAAVGLGLFAIQDAVVFFYGPSEANASVAPAGRTVRVGGLVTDGSVARLGDVTIFEVTDGPGTVRVAYRGDLPDLFHEGRGVVVEGAFDRSRTFEARRVLAKHDENYMPREVADRLKANGHWQASPTAPAASARSKGY